MACLPNSDNVFGPRISPDCRSFDFTLLFEDCFFGLLPAALFLVLVPQRLHSLRAAQVKLGSFRLAIVKLALLAVLLVLHVLYTALRVEDPDLRTSVGLASGIISIVATGAAMVLSFLEDQRSVKPSDLLVIYYSAETLLVLPQLRTMWQIPTASEACRAIWIAIFIFTLAVLIAESMHKFRFLRPLYQKSTGEGIFGFWGQSFFIWVLPVLQIGYSKALDIGDIPELDADQQAQFTEAEVETAWETRSGGYRMLRSTFYAYRWTFLSGIVPRLCLAAFNFCQPFLITATVDYIDDSKTSDSKRSGQAIVGAYVLVYLGWAISTAVYWRQTNRFNTKIRSGLISMIYAQTSRLKASDINDSAAITLMGTDVERVVQSQKTIHETWASVLEVGIAIWLLERQLLVACVVPAVIAITNVPTDFTPFATFAIYTIIAVVKHNKTLLSSQAFTSLSLISLVTNPLLTFIQAVPSLQQAISCYHRIEEYCLKAPVSSSNASTSAMPSATPGDTVIELKAFSSRPRSDNSPISFEHAIIAWTEDGENKLHDIDLAVTSGITMLIGPVGSGKSTLLSSVLGETVTKSGQIRVTTSRLAYCPQVPWIFNDTIRQNIIVGSEYDSKWYEFAIWACGLKQDFSSMPGGDLYRAGTDGLALSGGQKQRIALCRAIYSRKNIVILDDVFSGLDSNNISAIATRLFGQNGYFRTSGMTVLLATHTQYLFQYADQIVVLESGRVVDKGTYDNVISLRKPVVATRSLVSTEGIAEEALSEAQDDNDPDKTNTKSSDADLKNPLRRDGTWSVYKYYYQSAGLVAFTTCIAFMIVEAVSGNFTTLWIQWWVEANEKRPNHDVGMYIGIYALLFVIQFLGTAGGLWLFIITVINNTAMNLHTDLLSATLSAPFSFFQATEIGTLTNRFSQDMELIDMTLPLVASMFLAGLAAGIVKLVILCVVSKYLAAVIPALLISLVVLQKYYLRTSRQVRLLDLEAKAPLYTHFTEAVQGFTTIRAFGAEAWFHEKMHRLLNHSQRPYYMLFCIQQWLTLVMSLIVTALAVIIVAMTTSLADQYNAASVGVALTLILTFNTTLSSTLRMWTSLETSIGAVSRVQQFVRDTPRETNNSLLDFLASPGLRPLDCTIKFEAITAGYGESTSAILKNLSLTICPGEKVAICGPSGSGKSSLIMSLLRMSEIYSGTISIGGYDISTLERQDIHSFLGVVPQEPFLMPGTVRFNLDPFQRASDEHIGSVLQKVGLWDRIEANGGLEMDLSNISSWSVGERQLLALARALAVPPPVLILDEATSSVDRETEAAMQDIIEQDFAQQTVVAVIHRLSYIDRFDRVVFLKNGELVECDTPQALLARDSEFRQLYQALEGH
ncbi:hypothetical protein ASPCADRAFT_394152 [Aspergillus carbonarius ITEM 5010]|uniref:ABC transporter n=1 Tax=Aspergillus carbonarius (strain ITEM 5010) TaxID=602072 RepID=A0A1R3RWE0_ASPC5|nr:hypothetical protein ASPCADRAFT_394152 [Aspergillus carbonarius ITEM 5010]